MDQPSILPARNSLRGIVPGAAFLIAVVFVAYLPALHGSAVWDDDYMLTANRVMTEPGGLAKIFFDLTAVRVYYPVTEAVLWLECRCFGLADLTGYHAVNMLLHGINAVLLWRLLARLNVRGAFIAAGLFALHPVQVESVAWITEHKNTLSLMFSLIAARAYFGAVGLFDDPAAMPKGRWRAYLVAVLMYMLALGAKSTATTVAPAMLLIIWWKRGRWLRGDFIAIVPFFLLAAASGALTQWVELHSTGRWEAGWSLTFPQQLIVAGRAIWFYLGKLVWPLGISFVYPRWKVPADHAGQYVYPLLAMATLLGLWLSRKRVGRGPITAILFFAGTLAPALGFFHVLYQRYSFVADHFQYVACIGPLVLIGWGLQTLHERIGGMGVPVIIAVMLLVCGLTYRSARRFGSDRAVWEQALRLDPDSPLAGMNYGSDLIDDREYERAQRVLEHAAGAHPEMGGNWAGLGRIAEARKDFPAALHLYGRAVQLAEDEPRFHFQLANMLMVCGDPASALVQYQISALQRPHWAQLHDNMGVCYLQLHQPGLAMEQFRIALGLDPNAPLVKRHIAEAMVK